MEPESEAPLQEILALLSNQSGWASRLEDDTDFTGSAAARLTTQGFGPSKPLAANDAEEGKAKNRPVELVKTN